MIYPRDYFAGLAMQSILAMAPQMLWDKAALAQRAYAVADAMLRQRDERPTAAEPTAPDDPFRTVLKRYLGRVIADDNVVGLRAVYYGLCDKELLIELVREIAHETGDPELRRWIDDIETFK